MTLRAFSPGIWIDSAPGSGSAGGVGVGLLNSLAVLLHQGNFLFGFTALAFLLVGRPWRQRLKDGLTYAAAGSLGTAALAVTVGRFLRGVSSSEEFASWYFFWLIEYLRSPQEYEFGNPLLIGLRVLKGQLTAFVFGSQVVTDVVRWPTLLGYSRVGYLLALTDLAYVGVALLIAGAWRTRQLVWDCYRVPLVASGVWILSYKVLLHWWLWPTNTEYHIVTLPPLILLLLLGPISARAKAGAAGRRQLFQEASVAALLVVVVVINFWGGIRPWYQYGQMKEALTARPETAFRPDDFFVSAESGLDAVFHKGGNNLSRLPELQKASGPSIVSYRR